MHSQIIGFPFVFIFQIRMVAIISVIQLIHLVQHNFHPLRKVFYVCLFALLKEP